MKVLVDYPDRGRGDGDRPPDGRRGRRPPHPCSTPTRSRGCRRAADDVFVHHAVVDYAVRLVLATRDPEAFGLPDVARLLSYGASPRATLGLVAAGRALALLRGRGYVLPDDVRGLAVDVLAHRLVLSYDALADGVTPAAVAAAVLAAVPEPRVAPQQDGERSPATAAGRQAGTERADAGPGRAGGTDVLEVGPRAGRRRSA